MGWFVIVVVAISLLNHQYFLAMIVPIAYWLWKLITKSSRQYEQQKSEQKYPNRSQNTDNLSPGDLADLVLLRLELQSLAQQGEIDDQQQTDLNQQIDRLFIRYLADLNAVDHNLLWRKHRDDAWRLLMQYAEKPPGLPPWRIGADQQPDPIIATQSDFSEPSIQTANELQAGSFTTESTVDLSSNVRPNEQTVSEAIVPATPLISELKKPQAAHLIIETDLSSPINPFESESSSDTLTSEPATFTIDETDHLSTLPYQAASPKVDKPDSSLNQYAWKPSEPSRLERALKTVSGWHSMAIPFLAQNIGWFIGVFCFIAGSIFLVEKTIGYTSNLIAFFSFLIFTLALLFGGYQLRNKRPELEVSSYVIFILSLLLIPLTNITGTQLLINSDGSLLKLLFGLFLVVAELGVFYFAVTLVAGLMDRSLQQGLPKFFLALTAMQVLQMLLLFLPSWQLLAAIHLLIFALLSFGIYQFASQWLQAIFVDQHKISYFAAGTLIYAAVVSFVFMTADNSIVLPDGYYGFFLMLLCGLLFFIDAQLKQWTKQYAYLSRFSFLVYGLSVLALCLVAQQPFAIPTLILAIVLYAFIVWRYLTLTPLTILLSCYFWLYGVLVLQHLPEHWHFLASLPLLFSLYKAAQWALNKRQSAYLAVIIYRVLYSLLAVLTIWSLYHSEAGLPAMATAMTASFLVYYTLKAAPTAMFNDYSKIASAEEDVINRLSKKSNLLSSHWFYAIPALAAVTIYYTPRFLTDQVQCSIGLSLLAIFWAYRGLSAFFNANSMSETTPIEQRLNSALLCILVAVLPLWTLTDNLERVAPLFLAALIMLWLSYQLLTRWLFYGALLVLTLAILPLKAVYFPTPSGLVTMLMGIGLWFWLWYMKRQEASDLTVLKREQVTQKLALLPSCQMLGWSRFPGFATLYRDVIDTPLEQVMCLLWFLGMKTLYERFVNHQLSYAWLAAVFLVGLFGLLLIIRYSLIKLLPVPIALVLAAVLLMLNFWQLDTQALLLASALFALLLWQSVTHALPRPFFTRLAETLNPALPNNFEEIAIITHLTAFFIVMASVIAQLLSSTAHSLIELLTLLTSVVFLWLSDRSYKQIITRYLVLGFSVLAGVELISLLLHPFGWQTFTTDDYSGLLFVSLSLALASLTFPRTSYDKPSASIAIFLAFASVFLQLSQAALITPLDYSVLFLAGGSLLAANAKPKLAIYNFSAFMILVLATLWLEHSLFHAQLPFNLWLNAPFADMWLTLALLSLAISLLSRWLKTGQSVDSCYLPSLNTVATLCYVWSLLGTLTVFFTSAGHADLLAWIFSVLLLALFPLSKNRSGAAQIRGLGCASLLTLTAYSLLPVGLDGFALQSATALFGYALWMLASFVLPPFNKRYNEWSVEPLFFPCLGFLLVAFSGCWWQSFNDFNIGLYCLELTVYSVLMLRYSHWQGFAWLASVSAVGAVLLLENSFAHPAQSLSFLLADSKLVDIWLVLALLSLAMSLLSHKLKASVLWTDVYGVPLSSTATFCFAGSLLGTLSIFFIHSGHGNFLTGILLVLLLAAFSLSKDSFGAAKIRGFASACLSTLMAYSLFPLGLAESAFQLATILIGYTLWLFASFVLPHFNKRYGAWTIAPNYFPWLGLLLVAFSPATRQIVDNVDVSLYCLTVSIYCLLMLRYSNWVGFSWLSAFTLNAAVVAFNFDSQNLPIILLLWANAQLLLVTVWQRFMDRWQWQQVPDSLAFEFTSKVILISYLLITSIALWLDIIDVTQLITLSDHWLIGILLNLSYLHLLWRRFSANTLHFFIYTVLLSFWVLYVTSLSTVFHTPSFLTFWSLLLFTCMPMLARFNSPYQNSITAAISIWLKFFVGFATVGLLYYSMNNLAERLLSLAIIAGLSARLAGRTPNSPWLFMAGIEFLLLLHGWPLLLVENAMPSQLLPWYALQNTLLAALSIWFLNRLLAKPVTTEDEEYYRQALQGTSWLIALGLLELFWHGVLFQQSIMAGASPDWLAACAALGTALIINIIGLCHIRHQPDSRWLYSIILLFGAMAIYSRLLWLGAASVTLWDTAAIIGSAYILFFIQGLYPSKPLYNSALFMPALALFTVPLQLATPETSLALMASGLLYLLIRHQSQQKIPLYLAILVFNAGVYLWIPNLVERSQLIQAYVIPAALSVLMLLHLHSRELKPSVLMGCRLAAISSIYACATADVFLRDEQSILVFILAMALSIAGIVLGIALRTRAFLYAGISFLLINVIGQLLHFYPEQGMGKAIVLMVMGAMITGFMIWFNIKRTEILQRISVIQAQLETWE